MSAINNLYSIKKLLDLVKSRPAIYNYQLGEHNDRELIERLWQEIAFEMQTTPHICRTKWASLRSGLTRHLRNEKESFTTLGLGKMKKKWYLADYMTFLRNYICYKRVDSPSNPTDEEAKNDSTLDYDSNSFSSAKQDVKNENVSSQENDNYIEINSDSSQSDFAEDEDIRDSSDDIANYFKDSFTLKRSRPEESGDQIETFFKISTPHYENINCPSVAQPSNVLENRLNQPPYSKRSRNEESDLGDESITFIKNISAANKEIDLSAVEQPTTQIETPLKGSPYPKRTSQLENELEEQNMTFFKSILPDISKLSERRRRLFKQEVLLRLNKSLDEQEME